ncbi:MAG: flavin reductase [Pyrinomonadaceae bacterium]|nr:flavin reductase [Pyrinomonadaceae bacterium]
MIIRKSELKSLDRIKRLNIVNSISGVKPANIIGSTSSAGVTNAAIFSSVVHLGSNPALIGMIGRPSGGHRRDTIENLRETGIYSINHVNPEIVSRAHATSAKLPKDASEFKRCGLTEEFIDGFEAPFVAESRVKIGLRLVEEIPIKINETTLIIGEIELIKFANGLIDIENGVLDLEQSSGVGISGLDTYYSMSRLESFPYAREENIDQIIYGPSK